MLKAHSTSQPALTGAIQAGSLQTTRLSSRLGIFARKNEGIAKCEERDELGYAKNEVGEGKGRDELGYHQVIWNRKPTTSTRSAHLPRAPLPSDDLGLCVLRVSLRLSLNCPQRSRRAFPAHRRALLCHLLDAREAGRSTEAVPDRLRGVVVRLVGHDDDRWCRCWRWGFGLEEIGWGEVAGVLGDDVQRVRGVERVLVRRRFGGQLGRVFVGIVSFFFVFV